MVVNNRAVTSSQDDGGYFRRRGKTTEEKRDNVNKERTESYIRAWEEKERANANNRYEKAIAKIAAWESTKQVATEANLRQAQQTLETKRAAIIEKMKNDHAEINRVSQERRAQAQAQRQEEYVSVEEEATRFRSTGEVPSKKCSCFQA